jgi:peptide/nickel transport system substrate-binding protein
VFPWQWNSVLTPAQRRAYFKTLPSFPFSIDAAQVELAKSSVPHGFTTETVVPNSPTDAALAMEVLAFNLAQIGIKLNLRTVDSNAWITAVLGHKYPLQMVLYGADYADPNDFLSSSVEPTSVWNTANYDNPTVSHLLATEETSNSRAVRASSLKQIYASLARDLPYLALWYEDSCVAIRRPFEYTSNPLGLVPWWHYIRVA